MIIMKKALKNIVLMVTVVTVIAQVDAFAAKEKSKQQFSFWKPWNYFISNGNEFEDKDEEVEVDAKESSSESEVKIGDLNKNSTDIVVPDNVDVIKTEVDAVDDKNSIYLYYSDEFGRIKNVLDREFIGEYKLNKEYNFRIDNGIKNKVKEILFGEGLPMTASNLKINSDFTGSFKIGLGGEKKFKIVRQGKNVYVHMLSDKGEKLGDKYKLRFKKNDDRYMVVFDGICWEKSGIYEVRMREDFGEWPRGFTAEVPHIGCPEKGETEINKYYSNVLRYEHDELKQIYDNVTRYFYASTCYDVKYNKNNIVSVFRERKINGLEDIGNKAKIMPYKSLADVFDREKGSRLDITDILTGSKADIHKFIIDCYRKTSTKKDSIKVEFKFDKGDVKCSDNDIIDGVKFYVDDNDLVFVLDVFDGTGTCLKIGKAVCKINIKENEGLFTQEFLASYKG